VSIFKNIFERLVTFVIEQRVALNQNGKIERQSQKWMVHTITFI